MSNKNVFVYCVFCFAGKYFLLEAAEGVMAWKLLLLFVSCPQQTFCEKFNFSFRFYYFIISMKCSFLITDRKNTMSFEDKLCVFTSSPSPLLIATPSALLSLLTEPRAMHKLERERCDQFWKHQVFLKYLVKQVKCCHIIIVWINILWLFKCWCMYIYYIISYCLFDWFLWLIE